MKDRKARTWIFIVIVIILLFFFSLIIAGIISLFFGGDVTTLTGNVAVIPIKGTIVTESSPSLFVQDVSSSTKIIKLIDKADKNLNVKAIVFEVNSPGGSAVASDEIALRIEKLKKPTVAWIREVGASGAYWIASATDYIIANRMSITGSIGVLGGYLEFSGLLNRYNITYERLVSGEYKDMGMPYRKLTDEERDILQREMDVIHDYFIQEVSKNRNIPMSKAREISTGLFYIGSEAKELGLIDGLGGEDEVKAYLEEKLNVSVSFVKYEEKKGFFDMLSAALSKPFYYIGKGVGSAFLDKKATSSVEIWA